MIKFVKQKLSISRTKDDAINNLISHTSQSSISNSIASKVVAPKQPNIIHKLKSIKQKLSAGKIRGSQFIKKATAIKNKVVSFFTSKKIRWLFLNLNWIAALTTTLTFTISHIIAFNLPNINAWAFLGFIFLVIYASLISALVCIAYLLNKFTTLNLICLLISLIPLFSIFILIKQY